MTIPKFKPDTSTGAEVFDGNGHLKAMYKTPEWERFRARFLAVNPKCYACGEESCVVDHLVAHKGDEMLFKKIDNMIPMCTRCHNTVTAKFDRYAKQKYREKLVWLSYQRGLRTLSFPVKVILYEG